MKLNFLLICGVITISFVLKEIKKSLIEENKLEDYIFFTNNGCESFKHLINECINIYNKISFKNLKKC